MKELAADTESGGLVGPLLDEIRILQPCFFWSVLCPVEIKSEKTQETEQPRKDRIKIKIK